MATVYLDASLISAIITDRTDPSSIARRELARDWWNSQRTGHELFISQEVIRELSDPTYRHKDAALALVANVPLLKIDQEIGGIAEILVKEHLMPAPAVGDAIHVALCAVHDIEYLLSFNVRHLANPRRTSQSSAAGWAWCRRGSLRRISCGRTLEQRRYPQLASQPRASRSAHRRNPRHQRAR